MLKSLEIDNFKSLCKFKIEFSPLTVLIGNNAVGKSSVLHAIGFLAHFAEGNMKEFLNKRNWSPFELKSKHYHPSKRNISFTSVFSLENDYNLRWEFTLTARKENDDLQCVREKITDLDSEKVLLSREIKKMTWFDFSKNQYDVFPEIQLYGSMLSLIENEDKSIERFPHLLHLKKFIKGIESFELLSPEKMKKTSRFDAADLGIGGERLGAFLHSLTTEQRNEIDNKVKELYPYLDKVITWKKQYGHIHLQINEFYGETGSYAINSNYISDGLLRIIAIVSLGALSKDYTTLLLDEIEDGINPSLAADLINYLSIIGQKQNKQILVTTHSPVMLNYFNKDSIVFLWKGQDGITQADKMFESPEMIDHLRFMNPGEVWLNFESKDIEDSLLKWKKTVSGGEDAD
ncbi:MAG: AAA family ATPase [Desulfotomaculaceae bacterium]